MCTNLHKVRALLIHSICYSEFGYIEIHNCMITYILLYVKILSETVVHLLFEHSEM